jgi:phosphinothricin acetyltransferase
MTIIVDDWPQAKEASMILREAAESDLPAILAIYNEVIATSTAIYADSPASLDERLAWFRARRSNGQPILVASAGEDIVGFASFGDFRAWPGYRYTVEHSVHVRHDRRGCGVGRALMEALIPQAAARGKHVMIAGVDAANQPSLRFHGRLGFTPVAHFREVGFKFGRWLDLMFLQRWLDAPGAPRA